MTTKNADSSDDAGADGDEGDSGGVSRAILIVRLIYILATDLVTIDEIQARLHIGRRRAYRLLRAVRVQLGTIFPVGSEYNPEGRVCYFLTNPGKVSIARLCAMPERA